MRFAKGIPFVNIKISILKFNMNCMEYHFMFMRYYNDMFI